MLQRWHNRLEALFGLLFVFHAENTPSGEGESTPGVAPGEPVQDTTASLAAMSDTSPGLA